MSRNELVQLNASSAFARSRAQELARLTGMTVAQIVEDALRGYAPPGPPARVGNLVLCGAILVQPAKGKRISAVEANEALDASRERGK